MTSYPLGWLADVLRAEGCRVIEESGWKSRGRPASSGSFTPRGLVRHWDASSPGSHGAISTVLNGTSDTPGPLCHILTCRGNSSHKPSVHIIAAGRANHAGTGDGWGNIPQDQGNTYAVGHEIAQTVDQKWPEDQLDQVRRAEGAIMRKLKATASKSLPAHSEYAAGRKIDVTGGSHGQKMNSERSQVQAVIDGAPGEEDELMKYFNLGISAPLKIPAKAWKRVVWTKENSDDGGFHKDGDAGIYIKSGLIFVSLYARISGPSTGELVARIMRAPGGSKTGDGTILAAEDRVLTPDPQHVLVTCPPYNGGDDGIFVELWAQEDASLDYIQIRGAVGTRG